MGRWKKRQDIFVTEAGGETKDKDITKKYTVPWYYAGMIRAKRVVILIGRQTDRVGNVAEEGMTDNEILYVIVT